MKTFLALCLLMGGWVAPLWGANNSLKFKMNDGFMEGQLWVQEDSHQVTLYFEGYNQQLHTCKVGPIPLTEVGGLYSNSKIFARHITANTWVVVTKTGWDQDGVCGVNTYLDGTYKRNEW